MYIFKAEYINYSAFLCYNKIMKELEVNIEKLDHYARGITRLDGKTIFVENALPNEKNVV